MTLGYEEHSPPVRPRPTPYAMGDPLAERAMELLLRESGYYPSDNADKIPDPERFLVYRVSESEHAIMDREDRRDPELTILTSSLLNPRFCLEGWYSQRVGRLRGYLPREIRKMRTRPRGPVMGVPLGNRVTELLQGNGPYENDLVQYSRPDRFECLRLHDGSYEVRDYAKAY
ncbi:hypothetical protein BD769DRAFT_1354790 [Suillus cothurnatus]|nr:hypothetical protein BD769DRAFT_1354790 [Suillus cothurnatus]